MASAAYLGPEGTHTHEAARACSWLAGWTLVPESSIKAAFRRFARGDADAAVLPIENSLEGSVGQTLDLLASPEGAAARIRREIVRPIAHALVGAKGLVQPKGIVSHPQALAQCADAIASRFPTAKLESASSTAEAARIAAGREGWAALASAEAAAHAGLAVLEPDLSDEPGNRTRFVVLAREDERPTGADRTSLVFGLPRDRPGGLWEALGELSSRGINLSRIESRPTRAKLGEYWFFVDLEAHREEPAAAAAIAALGSKASPFRLLGSYPRA